MITSREREKRNAKANGAGAGKIKSSRYGMGGTFSACVWLHFVHTGEMIMLDAADSTHNRREKVEILTSFRF